MKQMVKTLFLGLLLLFSTSAAQAVTLAELFNGGSIVAGDKLFDRWSLDFYDASDGRDFDAGNIDVTPLVDGDYGLHFDVTNDELYVQGDGIYAYVDLTFGFRVSVMDPNWMITDASMALMNGAYGWDPDGMTDVGMFIMEKVGSASSLDDLGDLSVEFSQLDDAQISDTLSTTFFAPQNEIWVTKNILLWAADDTDWAVLLGFDQRFSQTQTVIPEPSTIVLTLLGLAGLVVARKRRP